MKKFLLCVFVLILFSQCSFADDDSMFDYDMNFIDNPFGNQKPVSQKQFDEVVNKMQTPRKGLIQKFKEFLGRNNPENDPALKNYKSDGVGELGATAKQIENQRPNVVLAATIIDSYGRKIPSGHYQLNLSKENNVKLINFTQGSKLYGSLKAKDTRDDWDKDVIIYARIVYPSQNIARVIFSNLDNCVEGYARLIEP